MPPAARATALLQLLLLREELRTDWCRYDQARRVVYVSVPDRTRPGSLRVASRQVTQTVEEVVAVCAAQFGYNALTVARLARGRV